MINFSVSFTTFSNSLPKDSANKIKIALEEMDESNFWLSSIYDLEISSTTETIKLIKESDQLISILVSIINKLNPE
ncbi:MAG: four helix bundle protein [Ignavibacteria bacterium]|nr:four helix bundle protein [Ignavibacteria bacterium]